MRCCRQLLRIRGALPVRDVLRGVLPVRGAAHSRRASGTAGHILTQPSDDIHFQKHRHQNILHIKERDQPPRADIALRIQRRRDVRGNHAIAEDHCQRRVRETEGNLIGSLPRNDCSKREEQENRPGRIFIHAVRKCVIEGDQDCFDGTKPLQTLRTVIIAGRKAGKRKPE